MFHVKHEDRVQDLRRVGLSLGTSALDRLEAFEGLLRDRAVPIGAVARGDASQLWERHVLDSLRGAGLPRPGDEVVDLGSGAGLPGIPIAIARPDLTVVLAEARRARVALLELVVERLGLANTRVVGGRAEDLSERAQRFDVALARALAPPDRAWAVAARLLTENGRLLLWAGRRERRWPAAVRVEPLGTPDLANSGPVVIMSRQ